MASCSLPWWSRSPSRPRRPAPRPRPPWMATASCCSSPTPTAGTPASATLGGTTVSVWRDLAPERAIEVLETIELETRVELVLGWVREALAELELGEKIRNEVAEGMEKTQRDYLLRQQLAAIRKEL